MAKELKAKTSKLIWLYNIVRQIPPTKITNDVKLSTFRRALKLAIRPYGEGQEKIMEVYREDYKKYQAQKDELVKAKKKTEDVDNAIEQLQKEADEAMKKYAEENDKEITVIFDSEAFQCTKDILGESASTIFTQFTKGADGSVQEKYNSEAADELFDFLDNVK